MKTALIQLCSGDDPEQNLGVTQSLIAEAVGQGAGFVLTPEVTNCISTRRAQQNDVLKPQSEDQSLAAFRAQAADYGIWVLVGSLALKTNDEDGRFANRSFLIKPDGAIAAWYDKIHMFDVEVTPEETYRESAGYRPGSQAVCVDAGFAKIGMTVCYDVRFAQLYRALAQSGAQILTIPAAFSPVTGAAHWEPLLRARAIETGCYVLAPAQTGEHAAKSGKPRRTYGHSMVVSPWGEVLVDGGTGVGIHIFDLNVSEVTAARKKVPSLLNARDFDGP